MGKLGLVVAGGVLLGIALALVLGREGQRAERGGSFAAPRAGIGHAGPPPKAAEPAVPALSREGDELPAPTREALSDAQPRGVLRGRLVEAASGAPLRAEKIVLLSSPWNAVAETLRTRADGSFTSERAFPRGTVRAWVSDPGTRSPLVRHEAEFDPHAAEEWLVPVPEKPGPAPPPAAAASGVTLHGLAVDLAGQAVEGAQVKLFALGAPGELSCKASTDSAGEFRLDELAGGPHRLLVQGRFASSAPIDLFLQEGPNDAGSILLPAAPGAGAVRGRLVAEEGGEDPFGVVVLRELTSGKELARTIDWHIFSDEKDGMTSFEIAAVPAGDYELSVVAIDGREYLPAVLRVSPPADGLEFRARAARPRFFELRVRDATTGAELEDAVVAGRTRGQWVPGDEGFPPGFDRWLVYTKGHRPAQGDFSRARLVAEGSGERERLVVEVALAPGHGLAVLFKDVASDRLLAPEFEELFGAGVEGVIVLADGEPVAHSDADGLALLDLPRAPDRLTFARPGWRVVSERTVEDVLYVHLARE